MKTIITYFFCISSLILFNQVNAQITYNASDYAVAGDSFNLSIATGAGLNFDNTGAGIIWDFSALTPISSESQEYGGTGDYQAAYITNCILNGGNILFCLTNWNNVATMTVSGFDNINLGVVSLENVLTHLNNTGGALEETLLGATANGIPLAIEYSKVDTLYNFPLNFGDTLNAFRSYALDLNQVGFNFLQSANQARAYKVEGHGTLITPFGTFANTLKIKTITTTFDTTFAFGFPVPTSVSAVTYEWFDAAWGISVLTATGQGGFGIPPTINEVRYIDSLRCFNPNAAFFSTPFNPIIDPMAGQIAVNFNNLSNNATNYQWNFGDGGTSSQQSPSHNYTQAGTYNAQLIACNNVCIPPVCDTLLIPITIADTTIVTAGYNVSDDTVCVLEVVSFDDVSTNGTNTSWDFGDGNTSMLTNAMHSYATQGTYIVTLIASNMFNTDTLMFNIVVVQSQVNAGIDTMTFENDSIMLSATPGFPGYLWNTGETTQNIWASGQSLGVRTHTFWVTGTDANGCVSVDTVIVNVQLGSNVIDIYNHSLMVYPNPTTTSFKIKGIAGDFIGVKIMDIAGTLVNEIEKHSTSLPINIETMPNGIYLIEILDSESIYHLKLIKTE